MINVDYPSFEEESAIMRRATAGTPENVVPVLSSDEILNVAANRPPRAGRGSRVQLRRKNCPRHTRQDARGGRFLQEMAVVGAGPRASMNLILAAKGSRDAQRPVLRQLRRHFGGRAAGLAASARPQFHGAERRADRRRHCPQDSRNHSARRAIK